jgi:hypothetical protein
VDGVAVPENTVITAWIGGVQYGSGLVKLVEGQLGYSVDVLADDASTTTVKEGGISGDTVEFHIGGLTAVETGTWSVGSNVQLNLTAWNEYTLTIKSVHGTVIKNPDKATYHLNESVSLLADPVDGWSFTSWSGAASGSANPATVGIAGNTSVTANYATSAITCHLLSLGHSGNGSSPIAAPANSAGCPAGHYVTGATITLSGALPTAAGTLAAGLARKMTPAWQTATR